MPLGECPNRHMYNRDKYGDTCPICGTVSLKYKYEGKTQEEIDAMLRLPEDKYVCAMLVCVEGINKGRVYPIHEGKNFLGGGDGMDIQILCEPKVDDYRHAIFVFDKKSRSATLLPGESPGLVYLEGSAVYVPKTLEAYANIEIGSSKLLFVPFCGEKFDWENG